MGLRSWLTGAESGRIATGSRSGVAGSRSGVAGSRSGAPTSSSSSTPPSPPRPVAGWPDLAPIQRVIGDLRPNAQGGEFGESLTTWRSPALTAGELDHGVSPLAPSGLVSGLAEAVPTAATQLRSPAPATCVGAIVELRESWSNEMS